MYRKRGFNINKGKVVKSIIFNQHQVNHALKNGEGMFRVVVKPYLKFNEYVYFGNSGFAESEVISNKSPYQVGETIFVKEAFDPKMEFEDELRNNLTCYSLAYKADFDENDYSFGQWKSPVHMKQEHSRLTLKIKSVKVERLQDISEEDCWKEGIDTSSDYADYAVRQAVKEGKSEVGARDYFREYWNSTHKKPEEKWEANPWVFVYECGKGLGNLLIFC